MSWRSLQLRQKACSQDQVVLDLFKNKKVKYIGADFEFAAMLDLDAHSQHLVYVLNHPLWLSEMIDKVKKLLVPNEFKTFYISVNRYQIIGNDTDITFDRRVDSGATIINLLTNIAQKQGYAVIKSDYFDDDRGHHMNFVQPVTWIYGTSINNL
jgi:hypothetical protein